MTAEEKLQDIDIARKRRNQELFEATTETEGMTLDQRTRKSLKAAAQANSDFFLSVCVTLDEPSSKNPDG